MALLPQAGGNGMVCETMQVGIVVERRTLAGRWAGHAWLPIAALPGTPAVPPWTVLARSDAATRYYAGAFELRVFSSETGSYRDNLTSGRPCLWVALRESEVPPGIAVHSITADPAEGEAMTEPEGSIVDVVPMPEEIRDRLAAFVATHHVERPFIKRKRDRADPEGLARRPHAARPAEEQP